LDLCSQVADADAAARCARGEGEHLRR
jgi:hypothetical protein